MKNTISKTLKPLLEGDQETFKVKKGQGSETMTISPKQARYILNRFNNKNVKNRKISPLLVNKYSQDMKDGKWKFTGDGLSFSKDSSLLQGQHRLFACIKSNKPLKCPIATGLDSDSFDVMDSGKNRTLADVLYSKNIETHSPQMLAGVVRLVWMFLHDKLNRVDKHSHDKNVFMTRSESIKLLEERPEINDYTDRYADSKVISPTLASFCYWMFSQYDEALAEAFLDKVIHGVGLKRDTLEYELNQKLLRNSQKKQGKLDRTIILANIIIGWKKSIGLSQSKNFKTTWDSKSKFPHPYPDDFEY